MITTTWAEVDRKIGFGITLCGLSILLLNAGTFSAQVSQFDSWWVALATLVPALQVLGAAGWSRLPAVGLRAIWMVQPVVLFVALLLGHAAWHGEAAGMPQVSIWLLDAPVVGVLALAVRLPYALVVVALLAAAPPLSSLIFLGTISPSLLATAFAHTSNVIYVMLALVLRHQMDRLSRAQEVAARLQAEQQRARTQSSTSPTSLAPCTTKCSPPSPPPSISRASRPLWCARALPPHCRPCTALTSFRISPRVPWNCGPTRPSS